MGSISIRLVELDRGKEAKGYSTWSDVPEKNDASLQQESPTQRISQGGPGVEKNCSYTKRF